MNPARTFGPDAVGADFSDYWVYVAGPLTGALVAVGAAFALRGHGGGRSEPKPPKEFSQPKSAKHSQDS